MTDDQKKIAKQRLEEGQSYTDVAAGLGVPYTEVQAFAWDSWSLSWQGAKKAISLALKRLPTAGQQGDREQIADQIGWYVDYLYACARRIADKVESARRV